MTSARMQTTFVGDLLKTLVILSWVIVGCKSKEDAIVPQSGSFKVIWADPAGAPVPALSAKAIFGKNDPLKPLSVPVVEPFKAEQLVPLGARGKGEVLSLQSLELSTPEGRSVLRLDRPALDELRFRAVAPQQVLIEVQPGENGALAWKATPPSEQYWELPARESGIPLTAVMPQILDFFRLDDLADSLLRLRWAAAPTEEYHQQLLNLAQAAPGIDPSRLELLLDGFYYPAAIMDRMRKRERELFSSGFEPDLEQAEILRANIEAGERFADHGNRLILAGISKIPTLRFEAGEKLLSRLQPSSEPTDSAFQELLNKLGGSFDALVDQQKTRLLELAVRKKAFDFAASVALEVFNLGTDKSAGRLLDLMRRFPQGSARDRLSQAAAQIQGELTLAEFAAFVIPIDSKDAQVQVAERLIPRVRDLTSEQVLLLTEQLPPDEWRDTLILLTLRQAGKFDIDSTRALLLMASDWTVRSQMCAIILPKLAPLQGRIHARILQALPAERQRDDLIFQGVALMSSLAPTDFGALASLIVAEEGFTAFITLATPRLTPFRVAEAVATADLLLTRTSAERDAFLIKAAEGVIDLNRDNLGELVIRASSEQSRALILEIGTKRSSQ